MTHALQDMVVSALLRGATLGLVPVGVWFLLGRRRRRELAHRLRNPFIAGTGLLVVAAILVIWEPWADRDPQLSDTQDWQTLARLARARTCRCPPTSRRSRSAAT